MLCRCLKALAIVPLNHRVGKRSCTYQPCWDRGRSHRADHGRCTMSRVAPSTPRAPAPPAPWLASCMTDTPTSAIATPISTAHASDACGHAADPLRLKFSCHMSRLSVLAACLQHTAGNLAATAGKETVGVQHGMESKHLRMVVQCALSTLARQTLSMRDM